MLYKDKLGIHLAFVVYHLSGHRVEVPELGQGVVKDIALLSH